MELVVFNYLYSTTKSIFPVPLAKISGKLSTVCGGEVYVMVRILSLLHELYEPYLLQVKIYKQVFNIVSYCSCPMNRFISDGRVHTTVLHTYKLMNHCTSIV